MQPRLDKSPKARNAFFMAHPPPIGPALSRLSGAISSLEQAIEAAGPIAPGEHPALARQFNVLEQGLDQVIGELAAVLGQDQESPGGSENG